MSMDGDRVAGKDMGEDHGKALYRIIPPSMYAAFRAKRTLSKSGRRGERELRLLPLLVQPDRVALDIGANRGVYSYFLSKLVSRVIAYEPIPSMADFLERAKFPGVEVRCKAASDTNGVATFGVPIDQKGRRQYNGGQFGEMSCESEQIEVPTVKLDDEELGDVGFLKVDVEGHEPEVIRGATKLLERCSPIVMLEILEMYHEGKSEMVIVMEDLGYRAMFYDGVTLVPLGRAKIDMFGRNFIFFPMGRTEGVAGIDR